MTHYTDTDLLVIKLMPSKKHEAAHRWLGDEVKDKLRAMGLPKYSFVDLGAATCKAPNSSKEGDTSYKPMCRTQDEDWPTLVIEAGLSETLAALRNDARWWLDNSGGEVKIVIIISIVPGDKSIRIEKWCLSPQTTPGAVTRSRGNANILVSTTIHQLTVIQNPPITPLPGTIPTYTVAGAPLTLEFDKLLLRAPVPPEGNVIITAADLQVWAANLWALFK
jgi:hypothetical protein